MANFDDLLMFLRSQDLENSLDISRNSSNVASLVDSSTGRTFLHFAAANCNTKTRVIARYLIELGADIDAQDSEGKTPLILSASKHYSHGVIGLLLDFNANILIRDYRGKCAFQYARHETRQPIFDKLYNVFSGDIKKIASEFATWECCVFMSLRLKSTELTRLLLAHGRPLVCPECHEMGHSTVLEEAVLRNDLANVRFLLDYGVDVNESSPRGRRALGRVKTPSGPLTLCGREGSDPEILRLLLDRGANPTMTNTRSSWFRGKMQMYKILRDSKRDAVRMLLDRKVDLHARDVDGCCAVHYIAGNVHPNTTEELQGRNNYDVNARDNLGRTPLHYISRAHLTNVHFLIDEGANVDAKDDQGITPLMVMRHRDGRYYKLPHPLPVSWEKTKRYIECLLHRGADAQVIAPNGSYSLFENIEDENGFYWIQPVLVHLALIEARGTLIDSVIKDKICQFALPREYFEKCTRQLEEMKRVKVYKSISLFELLVGNDMKIEGYVRNGKLMSNLRRIKNKNKYIPYYTYVLRYRMGDSRAVRVMRLRDRIASILYETVGLCRISHHTIVGKITNYLGERDLRKLYCEKWFD